MRRFIIEKSRDWTFIIVYNFGNNKYMIKIKEELLEYKFVWI